MAAARIYWFFSTVTIFMKLKNIFWFLHGTELAGINIECYSVRHCHQFEGRQSDYAIQLVISIEDFCGPCELRAHVAEICYDGTNAVDVRLIILPKVCAWSLSASSSSEGVGTLVHPFLCHLEVFSVAFLVFLCLMRYNFLYLKLLLEIKFLM